jgi:hypothetical protein
VERNALIVVSLVILLVGARAVFGPEERLAFLFYDDAYYYFGVARNLAAGAGSTFDGLNPTNGYHPLWCWLLLPVFWLADDPGMAVRVIGVRWFLLAAAVPWAIWWALRPRTGAAESVLAAALFALHPFVALGLARPNGLETPLYALLIALFAGLFERCTSSRGARLQPWLPPLVLGLIVGLVILARMDGLMMAVAAAILMLAGALPRGRAPAVRVAVVSVVALTVGAAGIAGPSLIWNAARFGHPMPVSGRVVSLAAERERADLDGPLSVAYARRRAGHGLERIPRRFASAVVEETALARPVYRSGRSGALVFIVGCAGLTAVALGRRRRHGRTTTDAFALLVLFSALHYAAYVLWLWTSGEERYRLYYFMPEAMVLAAALGAACGPSVERWLRARTASRQVELAGPRAELATPRGDLGRRLVAAVLVAACSGYLLYGVNRVWADYAAEPGPVAQRHIYGWIRSHLPEGAILGARDAGKLGFFSGRTVVNLDGLINDQRLLAAIREEWEDIYIAHSPIQYLLFDREWIEGFEVASDAPMAAGSEAAEGQPTEAEAPEQRPSRTEAAERQPSEAEATRAESLDAGQPAAGVRPMGDPATGRPPLPWGRPRLGEILRRLAARQEITLREIPGAPDGWAVIQVIRR